jgi:hypothetical protein
VNAKVVKTGSREVVRHPRAALRLSLLAVKYRQALLEATRAAQSAARVGAAAKQAAANPKVQAEARMAAAGLMLAAKRARKVGVANASGDKQLVGELRRARDHAVKALILARHPRPKRHLVRTTVLLTGAGGAAYAGWRVYGRPQLAAGPTWQDTRVDGDTTPSTFEPTDGAAVASPETSTEDASPE